MSSAPIVIRCECQGLFQLPQAGMPRAMCPHCHHEVDIFPNGTARSATPSEEEYKVSPLPPAPVTNWISTPLRVPPLPQPQPQPTWTPPPPQQQKSHLKVVLISLAIGLTVFIGCIALCAGFVYYEVRKGINSLVAGQFSPEPDAAPLAEMQTKPLVTFAEYAPSSRARAESAGAQMRETADMLKSEEEFEQAEQAYQEALRLDPTDAMAAYQLACNYALWGDTQKAKRSFDHAMSLGFADYPTCLDDDELGAIRDMHDFPGVLQQIRVRYIAKCKDQVGTPVFFDPPAGVTKALIILLHGYGDSHEAYFDEATAWNALGFRAVALPGSIPHLDGKFSWSVQSTDVTDREIQKILNDPRISQRNGKVFLLGFSQGGMHAMQLAARHPERYAGAVVISPGGKPWMFGTDMRLKLTGNGCFYFIYGDEEMHGMFMPNWQADCKSAGWRSALHIHNDGHHFPVDWDDRRADVARFLLNE